MQLQEKFVEQRRPLIIVFVDLIKAFDTIRPPGLCAILQDLRYPNNVLRLQLVSTQT